MSITPDEAPESAFASDPNALFLKRTDEINDLLNSGASLSGHEPNCFFLNTRSSRFATASAASGFDFADDARAVVRTDWDGDGDWDLWFSNRSAPRVRFLRNNNPPENHFVGLRLVGVTSNRDGIGARVEVRLKAREQHRLVRSVRAGHAFLSQSSKWLYFGLGKRADIESVKVHWPGGKAEEFTGLAADRRYRLTQGAGKPVLLAPKKRELRLSPSTLEMPATTEKAAVRLTSRLPLPRLRYVDDQNRPAWISTTTSDAVLLNLWASWCLPCLKELHEFKQDYEKLRAAGIEVLALSADGLTAAQESGPGDVDAAWEKIGLRARRGRLVAELAEELRIIANQVVAQYDSLPVPSSFLIDKRNRLVAFYRGPVSVERLVGDAKMFELPDERLFHNALPHRGRWLGPRRMYTPQRLSVALIKGGFMRDAVDYARRHRALFQSKDSYAEVFSQVGNTLAEQKDFTKAVAYYDEALNVVPSSPAIHFNRALALHRLGKINDAVSSYRHVIELEPTTAVAHLNLGAILAGAGKSKDGLAHLEKAVRLNPGLAHSHYQYGLALSRNGDAERAINHLRRAALLAPDFIESRVELAKLLEAQGNYADALEQLSDCIRLRPAYYPAHFQAAVILERQGKFRRAVESYRATLRLTPEYLPAQNNLAWLLATHSDPNLRDGELALQLARQAAAATQRKHPAILDTLAAALAEQGGFQEAATTISAAINLLPPNGSESFKQELKTRGQLYRKKKPYRQIEEDSQ
jgi:tetratricopeptide (TPR) repeat protein